MNIRLHLNEVGFEHHPEILTAVQSFGFTDVGLKYYYSTGDHEILLKALEEYSGVKEDSIMIGNGSTDFLRMLVCELIKEGDSVVFADPSYLDFKMFVKHVGGIMVTHTLDPKNPPKPGSKHMLLEPLVDTDKTKMIFICTPGNPIPIVWTAPEIEYLCKKFPQQIVVIDQAYYEFQPKLEDGIVDVVKRYPNAVMLRTFSKGFGLAGMRLGYMIANPKTVNRYRDCYRLKQVNNLVARLGWLTLKNFVYYMKRVEEIKKVRDWTRAELDRIGMGLGWLTIPSVTNFFLVYLGEGVTKRCLEWLRDERGILVREMEEAHGLVGYFRVSVGTRDEMEMFVKAMTEFADKERSLYNLN